MADTNTNTTPAPATIAYGKDADRLSIAITDLPAISLLSLAQKGLSHYLGNEVASKVTAWTESRVATAIKALPADADEAAKTAATQSALPNDAEKATAKADFIKAAWEALLAGNVGARVGVPRSTPVESIMARIAEGEIRETLKSVGLVMPTGDKVVTFKTGESFTRKQLIERRVEKFGDRLRKAAEAELKALARVAAQAKPGDGVEVGAESLGL